MNCPICGLPTNLIDAKGDGPMCECDPFDNWMEEVDRIIEDVCCFTSEDLPDWRWRLAFDDGLTPRQAAITFFEEEGIDIQW